MLKKLIFLGLILLTAVVGKACEVEFKIAESQQKEFYQAGDEIVVSLKIVYTHRRCEIAIEDSKIGATGGKIVGATKWKQTSTGIYERKLKVKVGEDDFNELKLVCQRTCDKEGGHGQLILKKKKA